MNNIMVNWFDYRLTFSLKLPRRFSNSDNINPKRVFSFQRAIPKSTDDVGVCRPSNSLYDSKGIKRPPSPSVRLQDINPPSSTLTLQLAQLAHHP